MDTCDKCGKTAELYHNEASGLAYCDSCETDAANAAVYSSTAIVLGELERDAAAQSITCAGLAQDREYPDNLAALAAALDTAVQYESTARVYEIETLRHKARGIRAGVNALAKTIDHELAVPRSQQG